MSKTKSSSSKRWLHEHNSDVYVKRAHQEGYRARSVYKLQEIQAIHKILKPGMVVVDLGAAPGGWSEFVAKTIGKSGKVFAVDILSMQPIAGVEFIHGDFTDPKIVNALSQRIGGAEVDAVLSDMAPNLSGCSVTDQARSLELLEAALVFAKKFLKLKGIFLCKAFQGAELIKFTNELRKNFSTVKIIKPPASRSRSKEIFLLAQN
ncbi:MAG: 23S rRNA (uridine(2552)-2'-O)-methyltransferase [Gammaproteobacteria bacterium GWE2_37_16]|nr:MAG: 23S rRNA (uridine(2552)-2'-O)-methyltransferase [Gammaproteobacteria bacterium GWE2_37_16]